MGSPSFRKAIILGATGPTGIFLARSLKPHVGQCVVSSRSLEALGRCF